MEYWEFLIQREGDRGWRTIKTGNLQLLEGKYRIVVNSNHFNTEIETRVTHQPLGATAPQQRSQLRTQTTNSQGLLIIIPFVRLESGIWQFVCSGTTSEHRGWHRILKLRVLPPRLDRSPVSASTITLPVALTASAAPSQPQTYAAIVAPSQIHSSEPSEDAIPTEPLVPMNEDTSTTWLDGLDRLLEQIERESLRDPQPPLISTKLPNRIQLNPIADPPLQLIRLDRSTFSGVIPGSRLAINGACNLPLFHANLVQAVKIDRLSICLRHPQTSETIISIDCALPPYLDTFAFSGELELPSQPQISLVLGEVNLYDRHNIQLGSSSFTITVNLNPMSDSERSLLQLFDPAPSKSLAPIPADRDRVEIDRFTQELKLETFTPESPFSISERDPIPSSSEHQTTISATFQPDYPRPSPPQSPSLPNLNSGSIPPVDCDPDRELLVDRSVDPIHHAPSPRFNSSQPIVAEITGDLDFDFVYPTCVGAALLSKLPPPQPHHCSHEPRNLDIWEIVIDD